MVFSRKYTFDVNTLSERPLSKLSENHKINVFGPTELSYGRSKMLYLMLYVPVGVIFIAQFTQAVATYHSTSTLSNYQGPPPPTFSSL